MAMHLGEATITPGTISGDVKTIQLILAGQGYALDVDGNFGPQTLAAVQSFQRKKGLVPDGIVGPQTWDALQGRTPPPLPIGEVKPLPPPPDHSKLLMVGLGFAVLGFVLTVKQ